MNELDSDTDDTENTDRRNGTSRSSHPCFPCPITSSWGLGTVIAAWFLVVHIGLAAEEPLILTDRLHHLRIDGPREWSEFPEKPEADHLELKFAAKKSAGERTLALRQQDVKQTWIVRLNGQEIAKLPIDENDMRVYFAVPSERIKDGENLLRVEPLLGMKQVDDIRIGQIALLDEPRSDVLSAAKAEVEVRDADTGELLPARITVLDSDGALQSVGAESNEHLAVRPGIVYTADGQASFGLPGGQFTLYAGRGFEYSLDKTEIDVAPGQILRRTLKIRREVPTAGFVACDTHVHTLTHSGHGDATVHERMITLAAEGIELPIATDHNVHVDHEPFAREMGVRKHFTPVAGNEVTTSVGHFNIFPVRPDAPPPNHRAADWKSIFASIYQCPGVKVVILNHGRDLHSGIRPLGPKLHSAVVGENLEGWDLRANAMELVNSGAVQTEPLQLCRDWMGLLNRGRILTPVGGSDSHDVGRHFVGQGRTYIRARDDDPGNIDVMEAVDNFLAGRVMVSYGLLAELTVNDRFTPGDLVRPTSDRLDVSIRVLGPHWCRATKVELFANGQIIRVAEIAADDVPQERSGILWTGNWSIERPNHDVHLVAVAQGPGIDGLYWRTAKPYQPTSPDFHPRTLGISGAIWIDADGDGKRTSAHKYARRLVDTGGGDMTKLLASLADYDEAVASQAAHLWQTAGRSLLADDAQAALKAAAPHVARGIRAYLDAWRENQLARGRSVD